MKAKIPGPFLLRLLPSAAPQWQLLETWLRLRAFWCLSLSVQTRYPCSCFSIYHRKAVYRLTGRSLLTCPFLPQPVLHSPSLLVSTNICSQCHRKRAADPTASSAPSQCSKPRNNHAAISSLSKEHSPCLSSETQLLQSWWDGSVGKCALHQAWWPEFEARDHMVKGENWLLQVVVWLSHMYRDTWACTHTCTHILHKIAFKIAVLFFFLKKKEVT